MRFFVQIWCEKQDWREIDAEDEEDAEVKMEKWIKSGKVFPEEIEYELLPICEKCGATIDEEGNCDCPDENEEPDENEDDVDEQKTNLRFPENQNKKEKVIE